MTTCGHCARLSSAEITLRMQTELPLLPLSIDLETKKILKQLNKANKKLAELKGVARTIPNEEILIQTLTLQEARESSSIENIVTTQDELYQAGLELNDSHVSPATKEVMRYGTALREGFKRVRDNGLLTLNTICAIQSELEENKAGFRAVPGTVLKNQYGEVVYTPPQDNAEIKRLMNNLEQFINDAEMQDVDPLIKLAVIHYQFESIHPFYDGNGRTGRIICVLYLVVNHLLELPILYLSRFITRHKSEYYNLLQEIRNSGYSAEAWEKWVVYILQGIEETAGETIQLVEGISELMKKYKVLLREVLQKSYSHDLLNCLFYSPYTKIEHLEKVLGVSRPTATRYLDSMVEAGILTKARVWRQNYYINTQLVELLARGQDFSLSTDVLSGELKNVGAGGDILPS